MSGRLFASQGETMPVIALVLAVLMAATAAAAERWREFVYPQYRYAIAFPVAPKIEDISYPGEGEDSVKARVWSVEYDNARYSVTVADFSRSELDEIAVLDQAVTLLLAGARLKTDVRCRFNFVYTCREMSFADRDGNHKAVAAIYYARRLYLIEGIVLPGNVDPLSADVVRFLHSLRFINFAFQ
jgi:hypothetical protein